LAEPDKILSETSEELPEHRAAFCPPFLQFLARHTAAQELFIQCGQSLPDLGEVPAVERKQFLDFNFAAQLLPCALRSRLAEQPEESQEERDGNTSEENNWQSHFSISDSLAFNSRSRLLIWGAI
jgi:hypothetical protein